MAGADLAVSGFGTTAYELLATKTPFVGIPVVENQKRTARAFDSRELSEVVCTESDITDRIHSLVRNDDVRYALIERYDQLLDGAGADRVLEAILMTLS